MSHHSFNVILYNIAQYELENVILHGMHIWHNVAYISPLNIKHLIKQNELLDKDSQIAITVGTKPSMDRGAPRPELENPWSMVKARVGFWLTSLREKNRMRREVQQRMVRPSSITSSWYWLMQENRSKSASCLTSCSFSRYLPLAGIAPSLRQNEHDRGCRAEPQQ